MTPLDRFLAVLETHHDFGELTEQGVASLRRRVAAAVPYLPAIIATGAWCDWTDNATTAALDAVRKSEEGRRYRDDHTEQVNTAHVVGLLTGLALAHALTGAAVSERRVS